MSFLYTIAAFAVAIGILVTVHEFGHFWVARRVGVKVLRFSVGFGPALWTRRSARDGTEYVIGAVPLGGYVKMLDEREGEVPTADLPRAFNRQPLWKRFAVVVAGPSFNFLFAVFAYWLMFVAGISGLVPMVAGVTPASPAAQAGVRAGDRFVSVDGVRVHSWQGVIQGFIDAELGDRRVDAQVRGENGEVRSIGIDLGRVTLDELSGGGFFARIGLKPSRPELLARIGMVQAGGPAARAGLRAGDLVVRSDGRPVTDWAQWVREVQAHPGREMRVVVRRGGQLVDLVMVPKRIERDGHGIGHIGASVAGVAKDRARFYETERLAPAAAVPQAVERTWRVSVLTVRMLWKMLTLQVSARNLSGPISIARYAGASAEGGLSRFAEFLALVSVSLGLLNLLPIPVLDGGHLMYYVIEFFRGRPLSEEAQDFGQRVGLTLLVALMGLAFYNDIARLFG